MRSRRAFVIVIADDSTPKSNVFQNCNECETFERKRHTNDGAGVLHELRPEQPWLERQYCARHSTDGERNSRSFRPALARSR